MKSLFLLALLLLFLHSGAQNAIDIISKVRMTQSSLKDLSYSLHRVDTFTTGSVWDHRGKCQIKFVPDDKPLGFFFWGKRDDFNQETIYDGKIAYAIDHDTKTYDIRTDPADIPHVFGAPGGQMVFKDLVQLDTSKAIRFALNDSGDHYLLKMFYADNKEYDVTNRYKIVFINKKTFLPDEEIDHLVVLNKVQDQHLKITDLQLNQKPAAFLFENMDFLATHTQRVSKPGNDLQKLIGTDVPSFMLTGFDNEKISSSDLKGKTVLLDFWAVWCGPCVASMPKVQALYEKYKDKGLLVVGMMIEEKDLEPAKLWTQKQKTSFPMLVGNEKLKQDFKVNGIPLYILIDKEGKITFVREGYTDEMEKEIEKLIRA
jgi:thiol-disulfide isomerase/thioredoxin/outer membrane lipoprotein-sorting protein